MKTRIAVGLASIALLSVSSANASVYMDGATSYPDTLADGWARVVAEASRGTVFKVTAGGSWQSFGETTISANGAVSFLCRYSGAKAATVALRLEGESSPFATVNVEPSSGWNRITEHLPATLAFDVSVSVEAMVSFDAAETSPYLWIDDVYIGRQLRTTSAATVDIWPCTNSVDGILTTANHRSTGSWTTASANRIAWANSTEGLRAGTAYIYEGASCRCFLIPPIDDPLSDCIVVSFELKRTGAADSVVPIISLDGGASYIEIGIPTSADASPDNQTQDGWIPVTCVANIDGLGGNGNASLGFVATARGYTGANVTIRNVSISYETRATPSRLGFRLDGADAAFLLPNDDPHFFSDIVASSDAVVQSVVVTNSRTRASGVATKAVELFMEESGSWTNGPLSSLWSGAALEAGETNVLQVVVTYNSELGLETASPETRSVTNVVGGLGGVWINEVDGPGKWVEIAAPAGRSFHGWKIVADNGTEFPVASGLDATFVDGGRGLGFLAVTNSNWTMGGNVAVRLVNASGIVESERQVSMEGRFETTGCLHDNGGDWTQAGTNFVWESATGKATPGGMNDGQSIDVASALSLKIGVTVMNALVDITAEFSGDNVSTQLVVSAGGDTSELDGETIYWTEEFLVSGFHDEENLRPELFTATATAFGFAGSFNVSNALSLTEPNELVAKLMPSIGLESFGTDYRDRWKKMPGSGTSASSTYYDCWKYDAGAVASVDFRYVSENRNGRAYTSNTVRQPVGRANRWLKTSVLAKNNGAQAPGDRVAVALSEPDALARTNAWLAMSHPVGNYYSGFPKNVWVQTTQLMPLPEGATNDYCVVLNAFAGGYTGVDLYIDDLYLSFQDWAAVTNCTPVKAMPIAGQPYLADWTLEVGEGGATGLRVELWAERVRAGVTTTNSATIFQADAIAAGSYANPVLADGAVSEGGSIDLYSAAGWTDDFLHEGDQFSYWFKVVFDTNNGALQEEFQTDVSYFPDNASYANGIWSVTGEYGPRPDPAVTAWGPQEAWVNELHFDGADSWIEFAGRVYGTGVAEGPSSADIGGWKAVVLDASGAALSTTTLSSTAPLDGLRHDDVADNVGFYVLSGLALPTVGGLKVIDAEGAIRYAMCWGGSVPGCDVIYDGEPSSGKSLSAIGSGTPANATFWQEWVVQNGTEGDKNVGQSLENAAPKDATIEVSAYRVDGLDLAVLASDIDKPVEYSIAGVNVPSEWMTNASYTVSGLSQNTEYTYTLSARDALEATTNAAASATAWTLLGEWSLSWAAESTNSVVFTAGIDNLGEGETKWGRDAASVTTPDATVTGGSGPNTSIGTLTFVAQNGAGVLSADEKSVSTAYTKAAAPGAAPVATADPDAGIWISFAMPEEAIADETGPFAAVRNGNPTSTEYALRAWLYRMGGDESKPEAVDWVPGAADPASSGVEPGAGTWQTLDAWTNTFATAHWEYDITPTNIVFAFVARNHGDFPVESVSEATSSAHFELAVTTGTKAQRKDGSGVVDLRGVQIVNPFTNVVESLRLEFSSDSGATWRQATLSSVASGSAEYVTASGAAANIPVPTGRTELSAVWEAKTDIGDVDAEGVPLRWIAETDNASLADKPAEAGSIRLYFAPPTIRSITPENGKERFSKADSVPFAVTFDSPVSNLTAAAFTVANGSVSSVSPASGLTNAFTVYVKPSDAEAPSLEIGVSAVAAGGALDDFGNASTAWSGSATTTYDGKAPVPTLSSDADGGKQKTDTFTVTVSFDEAVTGLAKEDFTVANGTATALAGSGKSYTLTVKCAANSAQEGAATTVTLAADKCEDAAGNGNAAAAQPISVTYDTTKPVPTLASTADGKKQKTDTFTVTVSFDEAVTGLAKEDFTVANGTATALAGSGKSYTLTVKCAANSAQEGAATTVTLAADKCEDAAGNGNAAAAQPISVTYDTTKPVPTLASTADGKKQKTDTFTVTVSFDEAVTGLAKEDFTVANGTATALAGSGASYTLTVQCAANSAQEGVATTVTLASGKCQDAAGNGNAAAGQTISVTYDTTHPKPTLSSAANGKKQKTDTFTVTVSFDEAVTGLAKEDFTVANGTATALAGSGASYTLTVQCAANSAQEGVATTVTLASGKCQDAAGNGNAAAGQTISVTYDTTHPKPTLSSAANGKKQKTDTFTVTVSFDEAVTGLAKEDFTVANGTATALAGSGASYTLTVQCAANSAQEGVATTVTLASGKCQDAAGNGNAAAAQTISVTYDSTPPAADSFTSATPAYFNASASPMVVLATFNEPLDGNPVPTVANGTAVVASSAGEYTITVTPTAERAVTVTLPAGSFRDAAGNGNTASPAAITRIFDTTAPVVTLSNTPPDTTSAGDFAIAVRAVDANAGGGLSFAWVVRDGGNAVVRSGDASDATGAFSAQGSGLGEGAYTFSATATDAAGNVSEAATCEWSVTRAKPTVYITAPAQQPVKGDTATFTVTFSEAVYGIDTSDFEVLGGAIKDNSFKSVAATAPSVAYEVQVQATRPGTTVGLALAAHVCTNALGIGNAAATAATCEVDYTAPVIGPLSVAPLRAKTGAPVTYSFDVVDVNLDTVAVANQRVEAAAPSAAGVTHCTFATTATSNATFTIAATDTAGNATTNNSVSSTLVVDTTPPTVTWSGLPDDNSTNDATIVIATLESVSDGEDDPDPNVRVAWSLLRLAGNGEEETVASGEDWATTNSPVRAQATLGAGDWAFDWQAWDTAGNTSSVERISWTVADVPDPVVGKIVAGVTNAVFEVPGDASGEDVAKWLRLNNVDIEDVDVSYDSNSATTTVSVATSPLAPERATVELVVPAGAMGNTNEWSATASVAALPPAPRLEYVGRRLDDPNILEWKLWNVDSMPDAGAFAVTDAKTGAPHTYQGRDPVAQPWTTNGYDCATVTNIFPTSGENSYTIQVFEMGKDSRAAMEAFVWDSRRATDKNSSWMADAFVDHRLVYTDPASGIAVTNVGPAEVNLAMKAYGGFFKLNKATTTNKNEYVGYRVNVRGGSQTAIGEYEYCNMADGELQSEDRAWGYRLGDGARGKQVKFERKMGDNMAVVALHGTGEPEFNKLPIWSSTPAMDIRRIEWVCVPSNSSLPTNSIAGITEATIAIRQQGGATTNSWTTNLTWTAAQAKTRGFVYSIDVPNIVGGRVVLSNVKTTKSVSGASSEAYEIMLSEFAMFGAPVNTNDWSAPQVVSIKRSDTLASLPTNAVFTVAFDRPVRYAGNEDGLTPNAAEVDFDTSKLDFVVPRGSDLDATGAYFSATRLSDTEVEIVVTGLSGEGDAALVVEAGFAKTPGGVANAAATGPVESFDAVVPTVTAEKISEADRATAAATGILRFGLDLSEPATGLDLSSFTLTGGTASAELLSIANGTETGTNYVVTARVTGGNAGDPVSLALRPTVLTDLAGNTNVVSATWEDAYTLTNATSAAVPTVTLAAGTGGTVSPLGTVAAVGGALSATATPNAGYYLSGWTGATPASATTNAATGEVTASFTVLADGTVITANFAEIGSVEVTASAGANGSASWTGTVSVPKGGSTNVLFTAGPGYYVSKVNGQNTTGQPTSVLHAFSNVTQPQSATAEFAKIPDVTIAVTNGAGSVPWTTNVVYNADWSHAFTAAEGKRIASLTVNGAALPAAAGAASYTLQLFGVIEDATVSVTYRDNEEPPEPSGFTMSNLRWTGFDPSTGVATFTATAEGEAPETVSVLWVSSPGSATTNTAENCELSLDGGKGSVSGVPTDENALFLVGLKITEE